jgi:hypothetical protein
MEPYSIYAVLNSYFALVSKPPPPPSPPPPTTTAMYAMLK